MGEKKRARERHRRRNITEKEEKVTGGESNRKMRRKQEARDVMKEKLHYQNGLT